MVGTAHTQTPYQYSVIILHPVTSGTAGRKTALTAVQLAKICQHACERY